MSTPTAVAASLLADAWTHARCVTERANPNFFAPRGALSEHNRRFVRQPGRAAGGGAARPEGRPAMKDRAHHAARAAELAESAAEWLDEDLDRAAVTAQLAQVHATLATLAPSCTHAHDFQAIAQEIEAGCTDDALVLARNAATAVTA